MIGLALGRIIEVAVRLSWQASRLVLNNNVEIEVNNLVVEEVEEIEGLEFLPLLDLGD